MFWQFFLGEYTLSDRVAANENTLSGVQQNVIENNDEQNKLVDSIKDLETRLKLLEPKQVEVRVSTNIIVFN